MRVCLFFFDLQDKRGIPAGASGIGNVMEGVFKICKSSQANETHVHDVLFFIGIAPPASHFGTV